MVSRTHPVNSARKRPKSTSGGFMPLSFLKRSSMNCTGQRTRGVQRERGRERERERERGREGGRELIRETDEQTMRLTAAHTEKDR
jgi:hypothetical protein